MRTVSRGPVGGQAEITFTRYAPLMRKVIREVGVIPDDVDDALQEALLSAWVLLCEGRFEGGKLGTWLAWIARNQALNHCTRRTLERERLQQLAGDGPAAYMTPEQTTAERELLGKVGAAVEALPVEQRAVYVRVQLEGQRCEDIAGTLRLPLGTVFTRLRLAHSAVRRALKG